MKSMYSDKVVTSYTKDDVQLQLEEAQALLRLQHDYIDHLEKGMEVMKGMALYITMLEKELLNHGIPTVGFDTFFGMPEEKDSDGTTS
jgi:hypothetical protein